MAEQDRDQRTELPTAQRLQRASQEGQVAISGELLSSVTLSVGVVFFLLAGGWFFNSLATTFKNRLTFFDSAIGDPNSLRAILLFDIRDSAGTLLALLLPVFLITALVGALQTNFNISLKPLELKWDKMDVTKGFQRVFSSKGLVRGAIAIAKATAILVIAMLIVNYQFDEIAHSGTGTFVAFMYRLAHVILSLGIATVVVIVLISLADLAFQKWKHIQDLKMSIRDIRDEQKESEGDPLIRARLKRLQNEMGRQRMLDRVAGASVVITNPTHYAVALEYDITTMIAPTVTAKGTDHLARRIIETAKKHGVPVVERKPVARFLYFNIKIGKTIPPELYAAVAEVLNFVKKVSRSKPRG